MSKLLIELNAHITIVKQVPFDNEIPDTTDDVISDIESALQKMFGFELLNADIYRTAYTTEDRK